MRTPRLAHYLPRVRDVYADKPKGPRFTYPIIIFGKKDRPLYNPQAVTKLPLSQFQTLGAFHRWFRPTSTKWRSYKLDTSYFRRFGDHIVRLEYTGPAPDLDPADAAQAKAGKKKIFKSFEAPLSVFLDYVEKPPPNVQLYLAQYSITDLPGDLQADLPTPDWAINKGRNHVVRSSIWIGLPPTCTPLHRDPDANCFVQLAGNKTIRLFPPAVGEDIYRMVKERIGEGEGALDGRIRGEEMMMGREKDELEREVWGLFNEKLWGVEVHLKRGDGVHIPKGWWHSVRGHGDGVNASVNWWLSRVPPERPGKVARKGGTGKLASGARKKSRKSEGESEAVGQERRLDG